MIYRTIHGIRIPALGFGTFKLTSEEATQSLLSALEIGYRHIDTARMYGNEAALGKGLARAGLPREEIFVTTKIWPDDLSPDGVRKQVNASRRELGLEVIDLLLIHWPSREQPMEPALETLTELRDEGKLRLLGVSNFPPSLFLRACSVAPVACNQVEYHCFLGQDRLLELARKKGCLLTAYRPVAPSRIHQDTTIGEIARKHGKTPAQVALRWLLQQDNVAAIPKSGNPERQRENFDVFDFDLTSEETARIAALPKHLREINPAGLAPDWEN